MAWRCPALSSSFTSARTNARAYSERERSCRDAGRGPVECRGLRCSSRRLKFVQAGMLNPHITSDRDKIALHNNHCCYAANRTSPAESCCYISASQAGPPGRKYSLPNLTAQSDEEHEP